MASQEVKVSEALALEPRSSKGFCVWKNVAPSTELKVATQHAPISLSPSMDRKKFSAVITVAEGE